MAAKDDKEAGSPATDKALVPATGGAHRPSAMKAWIPAIAAIVIAPAVSLGVAQFLLLPRLQKTLASAVAPVESDTGAAVPVPAVDAKAGKNIAGAQTPTYDFTNMVVNLAGTMGTRYLKTSFIVTGKDPDLPHLFEEHKAALTDVTLNVLSSLTLADLEEPGSRNVLREKLVSAYNESLKRRIAEQVYFSDFVVQ